MVERFGNLVRRHPRAFDAVVAVFWGSLCLVSDEVWTDGDSLAFYLSAASIMSIALYWRRRYPIAVFAIHALTILAMTLIDVDSDVPNALLAGVYALAAWADDRRRSLAVFAGFVLVAVGLVAVTDTQYFDDALVICLVLAISWVTGDTVQQRRRLRLSLIDRAERAEALRGSLAQQAVAEERTRIARELHDVVAHSMSLMVVQAGAARRIVDTDPERSRELIESVESTGRNSLDEMRRILDVLRSETDPTEHAPQPDLGAVPALVDEYCAAGLQVDITHHGTAQPLSPSMGLTVYRIVQESLTNTLKHAQGSAASVDFTWSENALEVMVSDTGDGAPMGHADLPTGSQKGIVGMRERVAAFEGEFDAAPKLGGGWRVVATLPLSTDVTTSSLGATT